MLERVTIAGAPFQSARLSCWLFLDYLGGSSFLGDVAETICGFNGVVAFVTGGFKAEKVFATWAMQMTERLVYRLIESTVTAHLARSGNVFLRDAVVLHFLFPLVREYRFGRCWLTRVLRAAGRLVYPAFLRRLVGLGPADPVTDPVGAFMAAPPRPAGHTADELFANMPGPCQDAIRFYRYSYETRPLRSILAASLIPDLSQLLFEQILWAQIAFADRHKATSKWRVLKPYLASTAGSAVQMALSVGARAVGALVGRAVSSEPTGGGVFWAEHLTLLAMTPLIVRASFATSALVVAHLEKKHPATAQDEAANAKEREDAEEEAQSFENAWNSLPFLGGASGGGGGGADGIDPKANYYEVLGVDDKAKPTEIKKAYRQLALKNHPDRVGSDTVAQSRARDQMAVINSAYEVLMSENKRAQYDASRNLSNAPEFLNKMTDMSTTQLVTCSVGGAVVLTMATGAVTYAQYCASFQRLTTGGRGPLRFFSV